MAIVPKHQIHTKACRADQLAGETQGTEIVAISNKSITIRTARGDTKELPTKPVLNPSETTKERICAALEACT